MAGTCYSPEESPCPLSGDFRAFTSRRAGLRPAKEVSIARCTEDGHC